jgi:hypothetical protein
MRKFCVTAWGPGLGNMTIGANGLYT